MNEMAAASSIKPAWKSVKPMPTKRVYTSPVFCGDQMYVVGGCDASGTPLDCFESYHPGRDRWYRLANMPTKRASPCVLQASDILLRKMIPILFLSQFMWNDFSFSLMLNSGNNSSVSVRE